MAYVSNFEQELQNGQGAPATTLAPETTQASGTAGGGNAQSASETGGSGTGWTNLSDYIGANESNTGQMTDKIADTNQGVVDSANQAATDWQTDLNSSVESGTINTNEDFNNRLTTGPTSVNQSEFDKYYNASYQGPTEITQSSYYQPAEQAGNAYGDLSESTKTFGGQRGLVKGAYDRGNYTQGENLLDTFLVSGSEAGKQGMADVRAGYDNYSSGLDNFSNDFGQNVQGARYVSSQTGKDFRNTVADVSTGFQDKISGAENYLNTNNSNSADWDKYKTQGLQNTDKYKALYELSGRNPEDLSTIDFNQYQKFDPTQGGLGMLPVDNTPQAQIGDNYTDISGQPIGDASTAEVDAAATMSAQERAMIDGLLSGVPTGSAEDFANASDSSGNLDIAPVNSGEMSDAERDELKKLLG